ncbi:MAG: ABC transporter permease [Acidobacteria bacterium]|nr:ABC transporter permease [Acidobacteriota bacterium]
MAMSAVWTNRFRSALTILGIVIGITTVVTVSSLLAGLRKGIVVFFEEFGPNNVFLARVSGDPSEGMAPPKELKRRLMDPMYGDYILRTAPSVEMVGLQLFARGAGNSVVKVPGFETDRYQFSGADYNQTQISPREIREGRGFTQEEAARGAPSVVIGATLAEALFPAGGAVGKSLQLGNATYNIVGVFAPAKGGFFGENGLDTQILAPLNTVKMRYPASNTYFFTFKAKEGLRDQAIDEIRSAMRRIRKLPPSAEDDFNISTADSIIQNFDRVTGMVSLVAIALSALGLLVGGIGVMNIMLVSVTERTREIGVRKALGARRIDIVFQFLMEAMALTGLGGILGIIFSIAVTFLVSALVPSLPREVPPGAIIAGFTVSVMIGLFFGVWPATKAAQLDPVEALRYE